MNQVSLSDSDIDDILSELYDEPPTSSPCVPTSEDETDDVLRELFELSPEQLAELSKPQVHCPRRMLSPVLADPSVVTKMLESYSHPSVDYRPTVQGANGVLETSSSHQLAGGLIIRNETRQNRHALIQLPLDNLASHLRTCKKAGETLHEYVRGTYPCRIAVDFDAKQADIDQTPYTRDQVWDWLVRAFTDAASNIYSPSDCLRNMAVATSCDETKLSVHIVLTGMLVQDHREIRGFLEILKDCLPHPLRCFVDAHTGQSQPGLRIVGCAKGGRTKTPILDSVTNGHSSLHSYLVQPDGANPPLGEVWHRMYSEPEQPDAHEKNNALLTDENTAAIALAVEKMMPGLSLRGSDGDRVDFQRDSLGFCPLCKRDHERDGAFAYPPVSGEYEWRLYCRASWHSVNEKPAPYLIECETELTTEQHRHTYKCDPPGEAKRQKTTWASILAGCIKPSAAVLTADEKYGDSSMRPYPKDQPVMAIRAPCKTGKSVALREWMSALPRNQVIIAISHRRTFAAEMVSKANEHGLAFVNYQDVQGDLAVAKMGRLMVQYESLSRVDLRGADSICLILDEYVSIMRQMESRKTQGDNPDCQRIFRSLLSMATKVVALDAYMDDGAVRVLKSYTGKRPYVIDNQAKVHTDSKVKLFSGNAELELDLFEEVKKGTRLIMAFSSGKERKAVVRKIREIAVDLGIEYRVKEYGRETDDNIKTRDFADVNTTWCEYDAIAYTSTVEVGISFEIPRFEIQYGFFSNASVCAESALQMLFRNRCAKTYRVAITMDANVTRSAGATTPAGVLRDMHRADQLFMNNLPKDLRCSMYIKDKDGRLGIGDTPRLDAYCYNLSRTNASRRNFHRIFVGWICAWGMEVSMAEVRDVSRVKEVRKEIKDLKMVISLEDCAAVAAAPEISEEEYDRLKNMMMQTEEEKITHESAYIRRVYGKHETEIDAEWVSQWGNSSTIKAYRNLSKIRNSGPTGSESVKRILEEAGKNRALAWEIINKPSPKISEKMKNKAVDTELADQGKQAMTHANVHKLLECIGFAGLDDTETALSSEQIEEAARVNSKILTEMREKSANLFGVVLRAGDKRTPVADSNSAVRMVNSVLKAIYGMKLERARRKVKGKQIYTYSIRPAELFRGAEKAGVFIPDWAPEVIEDPDTQMSDYTCDDVYGDVCV